MSYPDSSQRSEVFVPRIWTPPDDPDKPPFPYIPSFTTQIHRHVPPPPFGPNDYDAEPRPQLSMQYMKSIRQSELVVDNPPLETAPSQAEIARLTINTHLSVGGANGPQVVTCTIVPEGGPASQPFQAVAKIYDPMYYSFKRWIGHNPCDVVTEADRDYSREAAAYEYLQEIGQTGSFAPLYYGSWTFSLPITSRGKTQTRPVRLILIEYLFGTSIRDSYMRNDPEDDEKDAYHCPEDYRLEVLALAMDGYVRQLHSGIDQLDFADRNVMIVPRQPDQDVPIIAGLPLPRVVLIDYNAAIVFTQSNMGRRPHMDWPRPCNPMFYFWDESMDDFGGWVPLEWHQNPKFMQEWLQKRFGTKEIRKLYNPVEEELVYRDYDLPDLLLTTMADQNSMDPVKKPVVKASATATPHVKKTVPTTNSAGPTSKSQPTAAARPSSSSGGKAESSSQNPNYEPPLSLKAHGYRVAIFNPRPEGSSIGSQPTPKR